MHYLQHSYSYFLEVKYQLIKMCAAIRRISWDEISIMNPNARHTAVVDVGVLRSVLHVMVMCIMPSYHHIRTPGPVYPTPGHSLNYSTPHCQPTLLNLHQFEKIDN